MNINLQEKRKNNFTAKPELSKKYFWLMEEFKLNLSYNQTTRILVQYMYYKMCLERQDVQNFNLNTEIATVFQF